MRAIVALLFAGFLVSVQAVAQQAPQAPQERPPPAPVRPAPPGAAPGAAQAAPSNRELADLMRAQTAAIKSLSGKLDILDARIRALEEAPR